MEQRLVMGLLSAAVVAGCGDAGSSTGGGGDPASVSGSRGVTQGGAQDIGEFRRIVAEGGVPHPDTLDPIGFFAEHAIDLPAADCGQDVCLHPNLAVAPRFDGTNWTMAYVALNTSVDASTLARPPVHVVVAIERSARTAGVVGLDAAMQRLLDGLRPEDRVSLIGFGARATLYAHGLAVGSAELSAGLDALARAATEPRAALYDALALAGTSIEDLAFEGAARVVLVTSGAHDAGVVDARRVVRLGEGLASREVSLSVIGVGTPFDPDVPAALGDIGAGAYYVIDDPDDLDDVFALEAATTLHPLVTDYQLRLEPAPGYRVGRVYGARRARVADGGVLLESPALFIGQRTGADDTASGRRGGGGGLFVELVAEETASQPAGMPAYRIDASWTRVATAERSDVSHTVLNQLASGRNPSENWPVFAEDRYAKAFMMLNLYLTLRTVTTFMQDGDCARALGVVEMMVPTYDEWQAREYDEDVEADWELVLRLRDNVARSCAVSPVQPQWFAGSCFSS